MKTKIGNAAIEYFKENAPNKVHPDLPDVVAWGEADTLFAIAVKAGIESPNGDSGRETHWQRILNALDRDERFEKNYLWIEDHPDYTAHHRYVRCFRLLEAK